MHPSKDQVSRRFVAGRSLTNVTPLVSDAEALPFRDAAFDATTCRVAPHHFPAVRAFAREVARVLRPGGVFVLEDGCSPLDAALDAFLDAVERRRDATHVRSYTEPEWEAFLADAGFAITRREIFRKEHSIEEWLATGGASAETARDVLDAFACASEEARRRPRASRRRRREGEWTAICCGCSSRSTTTRSRRTSPA